MELQQLRYFLVVANHLNLSQAAETLCISQPALSKMMARLQQQLSVQLYVRKGRGIALTDAGIALRSRAESIIYRMDEAEQLMTDMRAGLSGHVRIGAGPSFLTQILPEAIAELAEKQPNVRYTIREGTTDELYEWIKTREIDCALLGWVKSDHTRASLDSALAYNRLLVDDLVIVTRSDHPLQLRPPQSFKELAQYRWLLPRMSTNLQDELNHVYVSKGEELPAAHILTSSLFITFAFLRRTNLVTILARSALSGIDTAGIVPLEQPWLRLEREACLVTLKGMQLPAAASAVMEKVRNRLVTRQVSGKETVLETSEGNHPPRAAVQ
ncbi:DNA-binding transcriptional LysR family regulator [Bradyrhizobium niftali]|uniref:LysR family transcriptional regulator n=1 Tax=Bradyrhizobium niftali TaxID=2560055 RepID=UPI00383702B2